MNLHTHIQKALATVSLLNRRQRAIGILIAVVLVGGTFAGIRSWASVISTPAETIEERTVLFSATPRQPVEVEPIVITPSVYSDTALQRRAARLVLHAAATEPVANQESPVESDGIRSLLRWIGVLSDGRDGEVLTMVDGKPQWLSPNSPNTTSARPETVRTSNGDIVERESGSRRGGGGGGNSTTTNSVSITQILDDTEWTTVGSNTYLTETSANVGLGMSLPETKLEVAGTISGASIAVSQNATINGSLWVLGTVSGATLGGFGLTDCDAASQILQWDQTTNRFVCGTAITTGTGNILAATDPRFVNTSGDTMTGALTIDLSSGTVGLNVLQTISGSTIFASRGLSTSGALVVNDASRFKNNLTVAGTVSGASLTVMSGNSYILGNLGIGSTSPKTKLDVVGTISGSLITQNGAGNNSFMGNVGIGTTGPGKRLEINDAAGGALRLTYNDSDGSATSYADLSINSNADLFLAPSGGDTVITGNMSVTAAGSFTGNVGIGGQIYTTDTNHGVQFREGGDRNNFYSYGGTAAANAGHRFLTGGARASQVERLQIADDEVVFNDTGANNNLRVEGVSDTALLFLQASTDRVGIGTQTPKSKLEVIGGMSGSSLRISGSSSDFAIHSSGNPIIKVNGAIAVRNGGGIPISWFSYDSGLETSSLFANNSRAVFIHSGGNVTIGNQTSAPKAKLQVLGTISGSLITQNGAGNNSFMGNVGIGGTSANLPLHIIATSAAGWMRLERGAQKWDITANAGYFQIYDATALAMRLTMDTAGNVGLGTAASDTPKAKLAVGGTISGSLITQNGAGTNYLMGNVAVGKSTITANRGLDVLGNVQLGGTENGRLHISDGSGNERVLLGDDQAQGGRLILYNDSNVITTDLHGGADSYFAGGNLSVGGGTSKARFNVLGTISGSLITQNGAGVNYFRGNVGIGTIVPGTTLDVAGTISGANLRVKGTISGSILRMNGAGDSSFVGNVGIGTNSPLSTLHVNRATSGEGLRLSIGANARLVISFDGNATYYNSSAGNNLQFGTSGAGNVGITILNANNNVGISTATPKAKLDVAGTISGSALNVIGNIGVGTSTPQNKIEIRNGGLWAISTAIDSDLLLGEGTGAGQYGYMQWDRTTNSLRIDAWGTTTDLLFNSESGRNVGIGTTAPKSKLDVVGTVSGSALTVSTLQNCDTIDTNASGVTACGTDNTSDERLKTNINALADGALAFLTNVRTVTYDWNEQMLALHPNAADDGTQVGFIAQDFENLYPELVRKDSDGYLGINYSHVAPLIVQGLKELNAKVDTLSSSGSTESAIDLGPIETGLASLTDRLALLEENVRSLSGSTTTLNPSLPSPVSDLTASTLALDQTLTVGTDARIAGNLHLDGSLYVDDILLPGLLSADAIIANTLSVTSDAIIHGSLTLDGPLVLGSGAMLQFGSGLTLNDLIVENSLSVLGAITVHGMADFLGDVAIAGELRVSSRQAGNAVIKRGETSATISFTPPLSRTPVVTATPQDFVTVAWRVTAKSATGFIIQLAAPEASALRFDWTATVTTDDLVESTVLEEGTVFPLDSRGVPVSSSLQWNACIRSIPLFDSTGQPYSCSRYHNLNEWEHPDLGVSFVWNDSVTPPYLKMPEGYAATVTEDAATITAAIAAVNAEQSSEEPTDTQSESAQSSSSESSVSSDTSSAVESSSSSTESSAESLDSSSSSEASVSSEAILTPQEPVETPAEEPLMTPVEPEPAPSVTEPIE